ncbi:hypothetical protein DRQ33_00720 [bacterium]|nr:MAG: hypothetical protein DRQ33_00720 [bacterium]
MAQNAESIGFFDMYKGKPIPDGKKSLGIYFIFRAKDRTLTDEEVNQNFAKIVDKLCKKFDAEIRK